MAAMNVYDKREQDACAKLEALLELPPIPGNNELYSDGECFVPWDMFPCLFGSYSSTFDDMAIKVLTNIRSNKYPDEDLACEMFREILCTTGLCCYGTSPRVCFASPGFEPLLPRLIERWQEYAKRKWGGKPI